MVTEATAMVDAERNPDAFPDFNTNQHAADQLRTVVYDLDPEGVTSPEN